jgi:hypothetical protein
MLLMFCLETISYLSTMILLKRLSILLIFLHLFFLNLSAQKTVKLSHLKIKYALPEGWNAEAFGGESPWENATSDYCKCAGVLFTKQHSNGQMRVMVYPSTIQGLDSTKRSFVGALRFEKVEKYFKTTNKHFSFEKRESYFTDTKKGVKAYDAIRYIARPKLITYIIYTWQESANKMDMKTERELFEMVNAIEPMD